VVGQYLRTFGGSSFGGHEGLDGLRYVGSVRFSGRGHKGNTRFFPGRSYRRY
jgi:hypothetical protein